MLWRHVVAGEGGLGGVIDRGDGAGGFLLIFDPGGEVLGAESDDPEAHNGVGFAAVFGALAPEITGLVGLEPKVVAAIGHHVDLAAELGNPEGVDDIGSAEVDAHGTAGGDDEFVAGQELPSAVDLLGGVFELEPPLQTAGVNLIGVGPLFIRNVVGIPYGL